MKKIIIPLPLFDFDPTEVAVPWKIWNDAGFELHFSTSSGQMAQADPIMITGQGLGIFKETLRADKNGRKAYDQLIHDHRFNAPIKWEEINPDKFDAIHCPGGHAKGMREYLESDILKKVVANFFEKNKPVSAVCHGVVLVARSFSTENGKSVLEGRKTTSLLKSQELLAWNLTRLWLGDYYRTYLDQTVEEEVRKCLGQNGIFKGGPFPLKRDSLKNLNPGFVCVDGYYLSARWPGDVHSLALKFKDLLN
jgi:protease I